MDCFRSTSFGLSESEQEVRLATVMYATVEFVSYWTSFGWTLLLCTECVTVCMQMDSSDPLNGIDKENTDILMYCTGGIRCDVYSTILR